MKGLGADTTAHRQNVAFRWMHRMKKCEQPIYEESIKSLRKNFSLLAYGFSWLEYRLTRPWQNLQKSLCKRAGRSL